MRHAAIEFRSDHYVRVNGKGFPDVWHKVAGAYLCGDGRWVRIHANFPHHREGVLKLLGCASEREAVQAELNKWKAEDFETACAERGLVVTAMRSFAEWDATPQGQALVAQAPVQIDKIADAPLQPLPPAERPLSGVRVLDLTRVIAGPVCGRTLASHGADVLLITAAHLHSIEALVVDTGRGKLSTRIDLREAHDRDRLMELMRGADVFVQGYRPGGIAAQGFSPEESARIRPGIVYVSLCAYGYQGPWANRRGFDSLVQTASGFNDAEGRVAGTDKPKPLPCQALDHAAGFLMAFGAIAALHRRVREGGSWHVRVSLAATGRWMRTLGRVEGGLAFPDPDFSSVQDLLETSPSGFGTLTAVRPSAVLSETPAQWIRPSVPLGTHPPAWPG
jgi:crotonobetainyl-CoA:carnitine CoA-transferase CaiB-like acyl-CoA transferase